MRSVRRAGIIGGVTALGLTVTLAVSAVGPTGSVFGPGPAAAASGLQAFDDCAELTDWYVGAALEQVTAYGLGGYGYPVIAEDDMVLGARLTAAAPVAEAQTSPTAAVDNGATGTNVQEAGVDEPDVAKTDGVQTYVVRGRTLTVTDVSGDTPQEVARLDLPAALHGAEMLLVGDRIVLIAGRATYSGAGPFAPGRIAYSPRIQQTTVGIVDVTDPTQPTVESGRTIGGTLVSAREHDGTVRLVVAATPSLDFVLPDRGVTPAAALRENRRIVREAGGQDWLPQQVIDGGGPQPLLDCADVTHPKAQAGLGTLSVLTFAPGADTAVDTLALAAGGDLVYASADRMYVATSQADQWPVPLVDAPLVDGPEPAGAGNGTSTGVHAFDASGDTTTYIASGQVPGWTPDRWSFSEHEGRLRVASMLGSMWDPRESAVTVLEEKGDLLTRVGTVAGMGRGEQIQSVRWFDDLAVIVTFRQVDPLYTVDLSDPTQPEVLGELKIPGFSAYLHPVGDDLLFGVGQDATTRGWSRGSQVSLFDLADLADPKRLSSLGLGRHRYSIVEEDSRSFSYLPEDRIALVPLGGNGGTRLAAIRLGSSSMLRHVGSIELPGWAGDLRALPLPDGRVALVAHGEVRDVVEPEDF